MPMTVFYFTLIPVGIIWFLNAYRIYLSNGRTITAWIIIMIVLGIANIIPFIIDFFIGLQRAICCTAPVNFQLSKRKIRKRKEKAVTICISEETLLSANNIQDFSERCFPSISNISELRSVLNKTSVHLSFFHGDYDYSLYIRMAECSIRHINSVYILRKKELDNEKLKEELLELIEGATLSYSLYKWHTTCFDEYGYQKEVFSFSTSDKDAFMKKLTDEKIIGSSIYLYKSESREFFSLRLSYEGI